MCAEPGDCETVRGLLSDYMDGGLLPAERELVIRHLDVCRDCSDTLADYRLIGEICRSMFDAADKEPDFTAMAARAKEEGRKPSAPAHIEFPRRAWRLPFFVVLRVAAAVAISFGAVFAATVYLHDHGAYYAGSRRAAGSGGDTALAQARPSERKTDGEVAGSEIAAATQDGARRVPIGSNDVSLVMDGTAQWGEEIGSPGGRIFGKPLLGVVIGGRLVDSIGRPVAAEGLLVLAVESGSPADQAGLRVGDLILEANGMTFTETSPEQAGRFVSLIKGLGPGATVEITYERAGVIRIGKVLLGRYRLWERQP